MAQRRDSPTPGGSRRPGQRGQTSRGRVAAALPGDETTPAVGDTTVSGRPVSEGVAPRTPVPAKGAAPKPSSGPTRPPKRSRLTVRFFVLASVLVIFAVSFASSTRAYLDQRDTIRGLKEEIERREANIEELEREKRRWQDPSYVRAQARKNLGYLMPGETGYQVIDENGEPLGAAADLSDPDDVGTAEKVAWWEDVWGSVELAGNPPPERGQAPAKIDGVTKNEQQENQ